MIIPILFNIIIYETVALILLFISTKKLKDRLGVSQWHLGERSNRIKQLETELNFCLKLKGLKNK